MVLLQVGLCWIGFMEAGRCRHLSLWLSSEADDDGLAGARGRVPADGRSKATDFGFVSDDSCGTQRSKAAIELLLASGVWFSRFFPPAAFRLRRCSAAASGDGVVRSLDPRGLLCNFVFIQGSFALSPGHVACGVEWFLGCTFELYVSIFY